MTYEFNNGTAIYLPSLGHALEYAHKKGLLITRYC